MELGRNCRAQRSDARHRPATAATQASTGVGFDANRACVMERWLLHTDNTVALN